jgi:septum site-determining protein MinD
MVLVVTSGKGGVGRARRCFRRDGQNVVVVGFDFGLRNLDLIMGAERRASSSI